MDACVRGNGSAVDLLPDTEPTLPYSTVHQLTTLSLLLHCCQRLFASADVRAWFSLSIDDIKDVELWLSPDPLSADDLQGWLVAPRIMDLMQQQRPLTQVGGRCTCSVCSETSRVVCACASAAVQAAHNKRTHPVCQTCWAEDAAAACHDVCMFA
jgi:hypothetical protein